MGNEIRKIILEETERIFGVKLDRSMKVPDNLVVICYQDKDMLMLATAGTAKISFCNALAVDKQTDKIYSLVYWQE